MSEKWTNEMDLNCENWTEFWERSVVCFAVEYLYQPKKKLNIRKEKKTPKIVCWKKKFSFISIKVKRRERKKNDNINDDALCVYDQ